MSSTVNIIENIRKGSIQSQWRSLIENVEREDLFPIALQKDTSYQKKRELISGESFEKIYVVTNPTNLGNLSEIINGRPIIFIPEEVLMDEKKFFQSLNSDLDRALVILTNNNVAKIVPDRFAVIVDRCPATVFAVHDYDNHHWIENSIQIAAICDVYVPAHLDNYAITGRINPYTLPGIPCGTVQWSRAFLNRFGKSILLPDREIGPIGMHYFYSNFNYRNRVIKTINQFFPKVDFLAEHFHNRSPETRWNEWRSHQLHWISPVFNDLPIRFFDALITGGIPLVPSSLSPYLKFLNIPEKYYFQYHPSDLISPAALVDSAARKFAVGGDSEIMQRHLFALDNFHVDAIVGKIIKDCEQIFFC